MGIYYLLEITKNSCAIPTALKFRIHICANYFDYIRIKYVIENISRSSLIINYHMSYLKFIEKKSIKLLQVNIQCL